MKTIQARASNLVLILGSACLLALMAVIVVNVIARLVASNITGSFELAEYCVPIVACASLLAATAYGAHVSVDLVVDKLRPTWRAIALRIAQLLSIGFWAGLAWAAYGTAWRASVLGEASEILKLPYEPMRWIWVGTSLLIAGFYVAEFLADLDEAEDKIASS